MPRSPRRVRLLTLNGVEPGVLDHWQRLLSYYLDCLRDDDGVEAHGRLPDLGITWVPLSDGPAPALTQEWESSGLGALRLPVDDALRRMVSGLRQGRASTDLYYGYPCWLEAARDGEPASVQPLFLLDVAHRIDGGALHLELSDAYIRWNPQVLRRLCANADERRMLLEDLGLLDLDTDGVSLADVARRLSTLIDPASVLEVIAPAGLASQPPLPARLASLDARSGWLNRAVLILGNRPTYTKGLTTELERLRDGLTEAALRGTAVASLLGATAGRGRSGSTDGETRAPEVVEVVPLDDDQRAAVRAALTQPLTVVTGPPGTGKSQVVVAVLANAWLAGQTVLFASRNHKAVDVVEERTRTLCGQPIAVRTGRQAGARNLRQGLIQFLDAVASLTATDVDRDREARIRRQIEELRAERSRLYGQLDALVEARNAVDRLDRSDAIDEAAGSADERAEPAGALVEAARRHVQTLREQSAGWRRLWSFGRVAAERAALEAALTSLAALPGVPPGPPDAKALDEVLVWLALVGPAVAEAARTARQEKAQATLRALPTFADLASALARVEDGLLRLGPTWLESRLRLLPDRLTGPRRRVLGAYRATIERLDEGILGRQAYAQLASQLDALFPDIAEVLPLWCVTNLSARGSLPLSLGTFDLVIIDEASQCDIASALPLLCRARRALVIGDPMQLRHVAGIDPQRDAYLQTRHGLMTVADQPYTYGRSSFYDLAATFVPPDALHTLRRHFRSHPDIIGYANRCFYENRLVVCTDTNALRLPANHTGGIHWERVTGPIRRPAGGGCLAPAEADAVVATVLALVRDGGFTGTVGVVTPFRAQAGFIRQRLVRELDPALVDRCDLVVETAHGLQGDERDVIVLSPCVGESMPDGARRFLGSTAHLFNVAVTRARAQLIVIGDRDACARSGIPHIEAFARGTPARANDADGGASSGHRSELAGPWEPVLRDALIAAGLRPMPQYAIPPYRVDLALVEGDRQLVVEVDGESYHRDWDGRRARRDLRRDADLVSRGWHVKRFWAQEVRDELPRCVREVAAALAGLAASTGGGADEDRGES